MTPLRSTLLCDGTSDRALLPVINWVLGQNSELAANGYATDFADPFLCGLAGVGLADRIAKALRYHPCDILFVHRDAEREPLETRLAEVQAAAATIAGGRYVPVVPVRMTEAWLLLEERAIRWAADNPNGREPIHLPRIGDLEALPDPKALLGEMLIKASEKAGRRLRQFRQRISERRVRVAGLIKDFSSLDKLPAFSAFRKEAETAVQEWLANNREPAS